MILTAIRNLFSRSTKIKLIVVLAGYILVSLFDMLGIVALVPLMSLLTMPSTSKGFTGVSNVFWQLLGKPDTATYALTIAVIVALAFTLKAIFGITFRWWSLRFLSKQQTQTAVQLFRAYLEAPYELHRRTSANRIMHSVAWVTMSVFQGVNSGISFLGEMFTVLTVVITLFILNPAIALIVVVLFAGVGGIFQLSIRRRSKNASKAAQLQQERSTKAILHGLGGVKEIIIRNNPGPFLNAFEHAELLKNSATRSKQLFSELPKYFLEVLLVGGIALISAYLFGTGGSLQMLSTLAIFGAAGFRLLPSITRMLASLNGVLHTQPAFEKLTTDFAQLAKEKRNPGTPGLVKYHGDIKLSNV
jgi:ABC-type multidrug transport system fused ATPase/permease subunit